MMETKRRWQGQAIRFVAVGVIGLIVLLLPAFLSPYLHRIMTKFFIFAILAMSLDFIFGYTGLLSLGHAAYFGVAGYTTGILIVQYGVKSFWISAPAGILMAGLIAILFGFVALRVSGIYFLLVTFALGELLYSVATKWSSMTGGSDGLAGIPRPDLGLSGFIWDSMYFYYFVLVTFIICFLILCRVTNSPFGHALQGIREQETRLKCLGYHVWFFKYVAFVIAALFAGVAGVLFVHFNGLIAPMHLGLGTSALAMLMVIIGGAGTLFGPAVGAGVIVFVEHFASIYAPERWPLILGCVFVVSIMYFRAGLGVYWVKCWKGLFQNHGSIKS